jgi:hypothetical protein
MLPNQEGDHPGAGRGGRGGWRAPYERRHLAPWAQKAEQIGVPLSASVFMGAANVLEVV